MRYIIVSLFLLLSSSSTVIAQVQPIWPEDLDVLPSFIGGQNALFQYMNDNLQYPDSAEKMGIEGKVYVLFNVEKDGTITDVKIGKSVDPDLDQEAVRLVKNMPKWEPGRKRGKATLVKNMRMPITFKKTTPYSPSSPETATFPGGQLALFKYTLDNFHYPENAKMNGIESTVSLSFWVESDGSIIDVSATSSANTDRLVTKEALRLVKGMPKWIPGMRDGKLIRGYYTLKLFLRLNDEKSTTPNPFFSFGPPSKIEEGKDKQQIMESLFPGGQSALDQFLKENTKYQDIDPYKNRNSTSVVEFMVDTDGSLTDLNVVEHIDSIHDNEALRVVKSMPKWIPAKYKDGELGVYIYSLPISFKDNRLPSFPGGEKLLSSFLSANIKYPYIAEKEEIQGRVMVQFNVMPDGTITDVKVIESVHPSLNKEAIRVVKSMPRWIPGKDKEGKPTIVPFTMPITFRLPIKFYSNKTHQLNAMVVFGEDRSTIEKSQSSSIMRVAQYMKSHPEDTLVIKGYTRMGHSPKQSQKLSETRAKVVKKALVNRYFIGAYRIIADGMGATNEFDSKGDLNDVVLFFIKEKNGYANQWIDAEQKQKEDDSEKDKAIALYDAIPPMPCFPDGPQAMSQFITDHLQYPEKAKKDSIQGNVFVSFNVEKEGTLTDIQVIRSISPELDNEACRLVNSMPKWIPAMKNGIPTSTRYILPVKFSLGDTGIQRSNPQSMNQTKTQKGDKTVLPDSIDAMPEFPGGQATLFTFLRKNIKYPVLAEEAGVQGRVIVTFVVDVDGSLTDIKVRNSVDPSLDKESLRLLKVMPRWIPRKIDGIPVRMDFTMPITFRLQ